MFVRSFQNNFWCFYFICGITWVVDRFTLLVYMYFGDKESISLDVDLY